MNSNSAGIPIRESLPSSTASGALLRTAQSRIDGPGSADFSPSANQPDNSCARVAAGASSSTALAHRSAVQFGWALVSTRNVGVVDPGQGAEFPNVVRHGDLSGGVPPQAPDRAQHQRVHQRVAEGRYRRHVRTAEQSVRLDEHRHLTAVATVTVGHPAQVQHPVHGLVRDFEGRLVIGEIDGAESRLGGQVPVGGSGEVGREAIA